MASKHTICVRLGLFTTALATASCLSAAELPEETTRTEPLSIPGASLYGIHFDPRLRQTDSGRYVLDPRPAWMGSDPQRLWTVELISNDAYQWFLWEGQCLDNTTCAAYDLLARQARVDIITRLDYGVGQYTVPTTAEGIQDFKNRLARIFDNRYGYAISKYSRVFILGNEPNLCIEAGGCSGPDLASSWIPATAYAAAYRAMHAEIHRLAAAAGTPDVAVLLAGPSGAGHDGFNYLASQLEALCDATVDGVALHAYGGRDDDPDRDGTYGFSRDLRYQLNLIDTACGGRYRNVPVFVTEFSRGNRPHPDSDFIFNVYRWLHEWNTRGGHNVVAATYFLGRGPCQADGSHFSFENLTCDAANDHRQARAAFQRAVQMGWSAGSMGAPATSGSRSAPPPPPPRPVSRCDVGDFPSGTWNACVFQGRQGSNGGTFVQSQRWPAMFDYNWASGGPFGQNDNFSIELRGTFDFQPGEYIFHAISDDGVQIDVNIDGTLEINDWNDHAARQVDSPRMRLAGPVRIAVRYYENAGEARLRVWWERVSASAPMSPTPSCECRTGVDNFCLYGPNIPGCPMTQPGGYCDPNGDGSFADADWVRGWNEYRSRCGSR